MSEFTYEWKGEKLLVHYTETATASNTTYVIGCLGIACENGKEGYHGRGLAGCNPDHVVCYVCGLAVMPEEVLR